MTQPTKCIGLFGKLLGHKFVKSTFDYTWTSEHCYRCGMPKGGWQDEH